MLKSVMVLFTLGALSSWAGDSAGNGGNIYEGHLQRILKTRVSKALPHAKNETLLSKADQTALLAVIKSGVPIRVVRPEKLDAGRYVDLSMAKAETREGEEGRIRLLDADGKDTDARLVIDTKTRKTVLQWDEFSLESETKKGTVFNDRIATLAAEQAYRYADAIGTIEAREGRDFSLEKLYLPPSSETKPLASAEYRYDFPRRIAQRIRDEEELIGWLRADRSGRLEVARRLAQALSELELTKTLAGYHIPPRSEEWACNLDFAERTFAYRREEVRKLLGQRN